jgi:hypothetical protein
VICKEFVGEESVRPSDIFNVFIEDTLPSKPHRIFRTRQESAPSPGRLFLVFGMRCMVPWGACGRSAAAGRIRTENWQIHL